MADNWNQNKDKLLQFIDKLRKIVEDAEAIPKAFFNVTENPQIPFSKTIHIEMDIIPGISIKGED